MLQKGCSHKFGESPRGLPAPRSVAAAPGHRASPKAAPMGALLRHTAAPELPHNLEKNHRHCRSSVTHRLKVHHIIMYLTNPGLLPRAALPPSKNKNPNCFWSYQRQRETFDQKKLLKGCLFSLFTTPLDFSWC